jgi:hypothetical protein
MSLRDGDNEEERILGEIPFLRKRPGPSYFDENLSEIGRDGRTAPEFAAGGQGERVGEAVTGNVRE